MATFVKTNRDARDPLAHHQVDDLLRWDPFRDIAPVPPSAPREPAAWAPSFDVIDGLDYWVLTGDIPGVQRADLEIMLSPGWLKISGERCACKSTGTVRTHERPHGSFARSFPLPSDVEFDRARTELTDGVLTLSMPKTPSHARGTVPTAVLKP